MLRPYPEVGGNVADAVGSTPKIVGIMQCKDEWPLNAVAITHALLHHVDEVLVVDDRSADRTRAGLARLGQLFPGRLRVVSLHSEGFWQEAVAAVAVHLAQASAPDWIYFLDADEFLQVEGGRSLREILAALPPGCAALRYPLLPFVSAEDLDEFALADYRRIRRRALPREDLQRSPEAWAEALHDGRATFFDSPFHPKVIFRNHASIYPSAGSHLALQYGAVRGTERGSGEVWAAHVSHPTRARLERKAAQGRRHVEAGRPAWHGWQNQVIYRLAQEGRLDEFWRRHSIPASGEPGPDSPRSVPDERFARSVGPALDLLERGFGSADLRRLGAEALPAGGSEETRLPLDAAVRLQLRDLRNLAEVEACREAVVAERDAARAERDVVAAERDAARAAIEAARAAAEAARSERDRTQVELRAVQADRDRVAAERDRMARSWSWRLTRPLRKLRSHARHLRLRPA